MLQATASPDYWSIAERLGSGLLILCAFLIGGYKGAKWLGPRVWALIEDAYKRSQERADEMVRITVSSAENMKSLAGEITVNLSAHRTALDEITGHMSRQNELMAKLFTRLDNIDGGGR